MLVVGSEYMRSVILSGVQSGKVRGVLLCCPRKGGAVGRPTPASVTAPLLRSWRGKNQEAEKSQHAKSPPISDAELDELLVYAPWAMTIAYEERPADVQRLCGHLNYDLLFSHATAAKGKPAWLLAVHKVPGVGVWDGQWKVGRMVSVPAH